MATRNPTEGATQGAANLTQKAGQMASSWAGAKTRMKAGYAGYGFGPTRVANYNARIDAATYKTPDPAKWSKNWLAKMTE